MGGRVAGKAEIITNSAQLGLELGLSLAIFVFAMPQSISIILRRGFHNKLF